MKCVKILNTDENARLEISEAPTPVAKEGEVLVRVHAAGINRPDILQRLGKYAPPAGVTDILGLEVAGEVVTTGERVCALVAGGGYAEYVSVPIGQILPIPDGFSWDEASALPETFFTVWYNVFDIAKLKKDETILIHGGSSGIGTTAIMLCKAWGARVIVTAGTDDKCQACLKLGADMAVNYKTHDFATAITEKIDVVLDMVGGAYVAKNLSLMNDFGRHISIAVQGGREATVNLTTLMQKRIVMTGSTLRPRTLEEKTQIRDGLLKNVWPVLNAGKIKPVIDTVFDFFDAESAHQKMIRGDHIGKIVLKIIP